jgi:hypothetical protein
MKKSKRTFRFSIVLCVLAVLAGLPRPAHATRFSGAYLLHLCEMDKKGHELVKGGHNACQSYIAGVMDYHNVLQVLKLAPKIDICVPEKVTMNQVHMIVLKYLRAHSEHDAYIAAPAVTMALYQAYPCRRSRR